MYNIQQVSEIIEKEIDKIRKLSEESEEPLERANATILNDYLKSLVMARKDEREIAKSEALAQMQDSELEKLAAEALKFLEETKGDKGDE